jgi:hypothetical protein
MRRVTILVSVLIVMLLGGLSVAIAAQEGTPPADEGTPLAAAGEPEGVHREPLGFGVTEEFPAGGEFQLVRVVIDPGAGWSRGSDSVSVALLYVESGALTLQFDVLLQVTRAATIEALAAGDAPVLEVVGAGTAVTLEAGDSVALSPPMAGEIRNDGDEPAVYLAAFVAPLEEGGATPAA